MRIAMIALSDMTTDARTARQAPTLAEAGNVVTVFALRKAGLPDEECRGSYTVHRVAEFTTASWREPIAKWSQARERKLALLRAGIAWHPDVVHANGLDTLPLAFKIARAVNAKVVFDAHELHDEMLKSNRAKTPALLLRYWRSVERRLTPRADAVITVGEDIATEIYARTGVLPEIVLNAPALLPELEVKKYSDSKEFEGQTVILYQGLVNHGRGLSQAIRAVARVPESTLLIQGPGDTEYILGLLELARSLGMLDRVRYLGVAPMSEMHRYCSAADIGLLAFEANSLNNILSMPNKLMQYMMAGLPMLGSSRLPAIRRVIERGEIGLLCDPDNTDEMVSCIRRLAHDPELRAAMSQRARELSETRYNWDIEKEKLLSVYEGLRQR